MLGQISQQPHDVILFGFHFLSILHLPLGIAVTNRTTPSLLRKPQCLSSFDCVRLRRRVLPSLRRRSLDAPRGAGPNSDIERAAAPTALTAGTPESEVTVGSKGDLASEPLPLPWRNFGARGQAGAMVGYSANSESQYLWDEIGRWMGQGHAG